MSRILEFIIIIGFYIIGAPVFWVYYSFAPWFDKDLAGKNCFRTFLNRLAGCVFGIIAMPFVYPFLFPGMVIVPLREKMFTENFRIKFPWD